MTWLFSKALMDSVSLPCSPELEAESSADTCSDGEPSAQWNVMPTPQGFWRNDKMMDASRLSRFGPTLRLLTESHGEAVLMSFLEGFPARTYPQPDEGKESAGQGPAFGLSSLESLAKYDPDTSTWRTPQFSLLGDWDLYSETWPRWGLMRTGECWVQSMSVLRTSGTESGLWQTPVADDAAKRVRGKWNSRGEPKLSAQVMLPIPVTVDSGSYFNQSSSPGAKKRPTLGAMAKYDLWPTPTSSEHKYRKSGDSQQSKSLGGIAARTGVGQLNPQWVEWLMGWPIGWTDLEPLEMVKFQEWQQQHSPNCQEGSNAA